MLPINIVAVLVAAAVSFIIGFLIHGPIAGKLWMRLANITPTGNEKFSDMYGQMFWNLVVNIITAYALAAMIVLTEVSEYLTGTALQNALTISFIVWAGFFATSSSIEVIWMKRPIKMWLFEAISSLIATLAMGAVLALLM